MDDHEAHERLKHSIRLHLRSGGFDPAHLHSVSAEDAAAAGSTFEALSGVADPLTQRGALWNAFWDAAEPLGDLRPEAVPARLQDHGLGAEPSVYVFFARTLELCRIDAHRLAGILQALDEEGWGEDILFAPGSGRWILGVNHDFQVALRVAGA